MDYKAYARAFLDLYEADLVGFRILVIGAGGEALAVANALEGVYATDVHNESRPDAEAIRTILEEGEADVVVNASGAPLTFALPAWITLIDLREDQPAGKAVLAQMVRNVDDQALKAAHACTCGHEHKPGEAHTCTCGHHHDHA